ncbi:hypothetical protein ACIBG8_54095 [Nonomuraea sp. NPDC050556]|uniref:hypothetical protein n=1 Tax=Nonomuraea sp. NPDC050556 TaxID=3364369 RepID=UPI0037A62DB6
MSTPEFKEFTTNIDYARKLIVGGRALEGLHGLSAVVNYGDLTSADPADLYRAAWSQAVAALDHWMHQALINRIIRLTNDSGNTRPRHLNQIKIPFEVAEQMHDSTIESVLRKFLREELSRTSYQSPRRITEGLQLVTGDTPSAIWNKIGDRIGQSADAVKDRQDQIVNRRNRIAHHADLDQGGNRVSMSAAEAEATVQWINDIAGAISHLLR